MAKWGRSKCLDIGQSQFRDLFSICRLGKVVVGTLHNVTLWNSIHNHGCSLWLWILSRIMQSWYMTAGHCSDIHDWMWHPVQSLDWMQSMDVSTGLDWMHRETSRWCLPTAPVRDQDQRTLTTGASAWLASSLADSLHTYNKLVDLETSCTTILPLSMSVLCKDTS